MRGESEGSLYEEFLEESVSTKQSGAAAHPVLK